MTQLLLGIGPEWRPTLDNFVVGRNAELLALLRHYLASAEVGAVYLWGAPGSGKSHLLQSLVTGAHAQGWEATYSDGDVPTTAHVVALDDVERLDQTGQVALFNLYNQMRESSGLLLVSGADAPARLSLRDDLRTRLGWGLVYQLHALDDAEKAQALKSHAQARGFDLPDEVTSYLLRHGRRDLPALLAVLDALDMYCLRAQRMPSVLILKAVLEQGATSQTGE